MRHVYECQMRWSDMDQLGHVNNVTYVDYLQEARIDMLAAHARLPGGEALAEGVVVVRHEVTFVNPLVYRADKVKVESWVTRIRAASFTMAYEIVDDSGDERVVYLRATSVLAPYVFAEERPRRITVEERAVLEGYAGEGWDSSGPIPHSPESGPAHELGLHPRFSDVDAYGHVNNVTYFEYFQEARIQYVATLPRPDDGPWSNWVVATTDVDYLLPVHFRLEPYTLASWFHAVGNKSAVMCAEIRDGDTVLARSRCVMVGFDQATQASTEMNPKQRDRLLAEVRA